jgi:hypothetical protein
MKITPLNFPEIVFIMVALTISRLVVFALTGNSLTMNVLGIVTNLGWIVFWAKAANDIRKSKTTKFIALKVAASYGLCIAAFFDALYLIAVTFHI